MSYYGSVTSKYSPPKKTNYRLIVLMLGVFLIVILSSLALVLLKTNESIAANRSDTSDSEVMLQDIQPLQISNSITSKIPKGYRAVAIPINPVSGVEGWVVPGVRVDIVWTTVVNARPVAITIVENAHVLSAGRKTYVAQQLDTSETGKVADHVTLLATLEDSQKIQLAKKSPGSLSLSLRGDGDIEMMGSETTNLEQLLKSSISTTDRKSLFIGQKEYILQNGNLISKDMLEKEQQEEHRLLKERAELETKIIKQDQPESLS